eukprot:Platyproteum_vivax@DN5832_c0_g1_i2.p1
MIGDLFWNRRIGVPGRTVEVKAASPPQPFVQQVKGQVAPADPGGSGRVFVGGLAISVTDEDLYSFFEKYGAIQKCHLVADKDAARHKGFGFVYFQTHASALASVGFHFIKGKMAEAKLAVAKPPPVMPPPMGFGMYPGVPMDPQAMFPNLDPQAMSPYMDPQAMQYPAMITYDPNANAYYPAAAMYQQEGYYPQQQQVPTPMNMMNYGPQRAPPHPPPSYPY